MPGQQPQEAPFLPLCLKGKWGDSDCRLVTTAIIRDTGNGGPPASQHGWEGDWEEEGHGYPLRSSPSC